jgi:hydrogenase expression/formation protein HypD
MFSLRDKNLANEIVSKIKKFDVNFKFMHVCGTHQDTLVKHGLDSFFNKCGITVIQGPGCPVCVTTPKEIEEMLLLAKTGKIVTTFGDMIQVPGEKDSLQNIKGEGADVRTVYGIEDAVKIAKENKKEDVVFMSVGFETTTPMAATAISNNPPKNFSILSCHRVVPPALKAIVEIGELNLNGIIEPGHVSAIIGTKPYEFLSKKYNIPQVIAGFEPIDLLMGVWMLVNQIEHNDPKVENEYMRVVKEKGNVKAQKIIDDVFESCDVKWRGFPVIPGSGLKLRDKFEEYNARKKYEDDLEILKDKEFPEPKGCRCGEVLRGLISSKECPLFGKKCVPNNPVGPCMVSVEGSCNIEYRYSKMK